MPANLYREPHGGDCCGIVCLDGFFNFCKDEIQRLKDRVKNINEGSGPGECRLIEAVVTDKQLAEYKHLKGGLKKAGFRCVSRFKNRNSGNICYVYHHYTKV